MYVLTYKEMIFYGTRLILTSDKFQTSNSNLELFGRISIFKCVLEYGLLRVKWGYCAYSELQVSSGPRSLRGTILYFPLYMLGSFRGLKAVGCSEEWTWLHFPH